jgi:hypothetical protein
MYVHEATCSYAGPACVGRQCSSGRHALFNGCRTLGARDLSRAFPKSDAGWSWEGVRGGKTVSNSPHLNRDTFVSLDHAEKRRVTHPNHPFFQQRTQKQPQTRNSAAAAGRDRVSQPGPAAARGHRLRDFLLKRSYSFGFERSLAMEEASTASPHARPTAGPPAAVAPVRRWWGRGLRAQLHQGGGVPAGAIDGGTSHGRGSRSGACADPGCPRLL